MQSLQCSVTFVYHTMKLELFITNTKKLSQRKRLRQRKQVAPAKKSAPAKNVTPAKKIRASKKSRASKKNSPQQRKVAPVKKVVPVKKSRAKGKKLFTRMKKGYISSMKLYARVYGTNRAPYYIFKFCVHCYTPTQPRTHSCGYHTNFNPFLESIGVQSTTLLKEKSHKKPFSVFTFYVSPFLFFLSQRNLQIN